MDTVWHFNQRFGHSQSAGCAGGSTKTAAHPEDGDGFLETSENLHILKRLSAGENFIKFCRLESFIITRCDI